MLMVRNVAIAVVLALVLVIALTLAVRGERMEPAPLLLDNRMAELLFPPTIEGDSPYAIALKAGLTESEAAQYLDYYVQVHAAAYRQYVRHEGSGAYWPPVPPREWRSATPLARRELLPRQAGFDNGR